MESTTTSSNKIELIQSAIQQLLDSRKAETASTNDDDDRHLLSKLLFQLESLNGDVQKSSEAAESKELPSSTISKQETESKGEAKTSSRQTSSEAEDVVKELKKLGRQNTITHGLLSGLMILTVAWQLSEVSILLKMKDGVLHPFRSLGRMVARVLRAPISDAMGSEKLSPSSTKQNGTKKSPLNPVMGLSGLMTNGQE
ncbi:hypothetical protein Cgig2_018144 [Carnegiea gigantea]|uniref:Uncharacterized protein n=1 Tax=Carnegiea gigantea TaxID=171969 RepID=A0A9Q1KYQ3_9CARY|nr:hypothetical protein Cgig2_018144 [Carnegiea gigantea]